MLLSVHPETPRDSLRRLGARIRALREAVGLTQEKLAYECGHSKGYLSDVEAGKRVPSLEFLAGLMERLEQPLAAPLQPSPQEEAERAAALIAADGSAAPYSSGSIRRDRRSEGGEPLD
jgi:transcriptional regulator with XRE-family HTH domain